MDEFYQVDIEAFPSYETIYVKFEPIEPHDNSSFFEVEFERNPLTLAKFLRKLRPYQDLKTMTPLASLKNFANEAVRKNISTCYCLGQNLHDIISLYQNRTITPDKEFPGAGEGERADIYHDLYPGAQEAFITENFVVPKERMLDGKLIKEGSTIKFFYKGPIE